jgi:hypothetical protein
MQAQRQPLPVVLCAWTHVAEWAYNRAEETGEAAWYRVFLKLLDKAERLHDQDEYLDRNDKLWKHRTDPDQPEAWDDVRANITYLDTLRENVPRRPPKVDGRELRHRVQQAAAGVLETRGRWWDDQHRVRNHRDPAVADSLNACELRFLDHLATPPQQPQPRAETIGVEQTQLPFPAHIVLCAKTHLAVWAFQQSLLTAGDWHFLYLELRDHVHHMLARFQAGASGTAERNFELLQQEESLHHEPRAGSAPKRLDRARFFRLVGLAARGVYQYVAETQGAVWQTVHATRKDDGLVELQFVELIANNPLSKHWYDDESFGAGALLRYVQHMHEVSRLTGLLRRELPRWDAPKVEMKKQVDIWEETMAEVEKETAERDRERERERAELAALRATDEELDEYEAYASRVRILNLQSKRLLVPVSRLQWLKEKRAAEERVRQQVRRQDAWARGDLSRLKDLACV